MPVADFSRTRAGAVDWASSQQRVSGGEPQRRTPGLRALSAGTTRPGSGRPSRNTCGLGMRRCGVWPALSTGGCSPPAVEPALPHMAAPSEASAQGSKLIGGRTDQASSLRQGAAAVQRAGQHSPAQAARPSEAPDDLRRANGAAAALSRAHACFCACWAAPSQAARRERTSPSPAALWQRSSSAAAGAGPAAGSQVAAGPSRLYAAATRRFDSAPPLANPHRCRQRPRTSLPLTTQPPGFHHPRRPEASSVTVQRQASSVKRPEDTPPLSPELPPSL